MDVPFSEGLFKEIKKSFWVNASIARALNRGVAVFTRTHFEDETAKKALICMCPGGPYPQNKRLIYEPAYNLRTSTSEVKDLAMSITTDPARCLIYAIVYGCAMADTRNFYYRLKDSGDAIKHPMLLIGLFAEIQRDKHAQIVKENVAAVLEHIINMGKNTPRKNPSANGQDDADDENEQREFVDLWLEVSYLRSTLVTWKAQLQKMVAGVDELADVYFKQTEVADGEKWVVFPGRPDMMREGVRIKERLLDIIIEYEEMERRCAWVIDGTSLANDMVRNVPS